MQLYFISLINNNLIPKICQKEKIIFNPILNYVYL